MNDPALVAFERLFGPEFGHGKAFDLARLRAALDALGAPHKRQTATVHVAGTNGKGSTIAFMRGMAEAAGFSVHAFTKPHLFRLNERFAVAGMPAGNETLIAAAERVAAVDSTLTQFDAQVAVALLLFSETVGDLAFFETGMGGREDSTNVIDPSLCVITPIAFDHQDALGPTLKDIAAHKAGILKPDVCAVVARQPDEAMNVIEAEASRVGATLLQQGVHWDAYAHGGALVVQTELELLDLPLPSLVGAHQVDNAGLAVVALRSIGAPIDDEALAFGVENAHWPARLQPLTRGAFSAPIRAQGGEVWVDAGHNEHAGMALARELFEMKVRRGGVNVAIVGLRQRKDATAFVAALASGFDRIIAVPLAEAHAPLDALSATQAPSLEAAMQDAAQFPAPRVVICGSFLLAAEALALESA